MTKSFYREILIKERNSLDLKDLRIRETLIYEKLKNFLKKYYEKTTVGLYYPLPGEPDLLKITESEDGYLFSLPYIGNFDNMKMRSYRPGDSLKKAKFKNLYEPSIFKEAKPEILIIPGLGFDIRGRRIGFGYGFYDRYCSAGGEDSPKIKVGVCFHEFLLENLPMEKTDLSVNYIITDKIFIKLWR